MIQFDVVTLFPPMFDAISQHGITARAIENKLYSLSLWKYLSLAQLISSVRWNTEPVE